MERWSGIPADGRLTMPITLAVPLDLPDVRVLANRMLEEGTVLIEVESTVRTAQCHRCGRDIDRFHGFDRPIRLRHLPVCGRQVVIEIRPKRYRCPHCEGGPTTTQRCAWYDPNRPHATAFEQDVLKRLIHGTVADVSRQFGLGVKAVEGILDARLAPAVDWTAFSTLETLGIDEVALLKGHGHDVAVVWMRDAEGHNPVLAVLPDRLRATVQAFLETIPDVLKATVRRVCMDMWEGYAGAVAAALPEAQVVVDRFHIAVHYREAVDTLRQAECHRLNADRPPERAIPTAALRPLLRREWRSLNPDQPGKVIERFEQTPTLASADVLRTLLTAIFDQTPDQATAQSRLQLWVTQVKASNLHCFDKFFDTLDHWQDGILNDFEGGHNSGFVEGLNNTLKLLKHCCFGLDDPTELFRRLWLDIEGPRLWA
ncbi:ISL3 family transposase [Candidatus Competibacter phosphatis]|uniref:ISL3 family transposase n=1 Tax=Candidatus Competibacter phosphatis TaxID=221280 RepID=A0ABX1THP7_9GAMM|nr:ISL3 family transposase [Candidatus Competibacter phosphatis]NMQ18896.1 ISL3 family transposase [Candidatus Competibacter phosphatis]